MGKYTDRRLVARPEPHNTLKTDSTVGLLHISSDVFKLPNYLWGELEPAMRPQETSHLAPWEGKRELERSGDQKI